MHSVAKISIISYKHELSNDRKTNKKTVNSELAYSSSFCRDDNTIFPITCETLQIVQENH